jgi:DNA-binding IscR family transcriptional regulator
MRISKQKEEKISEQILLFLFSQSPKAIFTAHIAQELARDEEFVKKLLIELEKKGLATQVKKNNDGVDYSRRMRWQLSGKAYDAYKKLQ